MLSKHFQIITCDVSGATQFQDVFQILKLIYLLGTCMHCKGIVIQLVFMENLVLKVTFASEDVSIPPLYITTKVTRELYLHTKAISPPSSTEV